MSHSHFPTGHRRNECRASEKFHERVNHVRLLDETAFPFPAPNQSPGALRSSKRADSRLRSPEPRRSHPGRKDICIRLDRLHKSSIPRGGPSPFPGPSWGLCPQTPGAFRIGPMGKRLNKSCRAAGKTDGTTRRQRPLWHCPSLRLPSGRAVSCERYGTHNPHQAASPNLQSTIHPQIQPD